MNLLVENKYISEMVCGSNFSYIVNDNSDFLSTEYKVLQSQVDSCFVKCMKMMYNGKIQLFYLTKNLKALSSMVNTLDPDRFLTIMGNLISDIIDVKHNGFLLCRNVDISFEHIYVDPATYKVRLVYLPLNKRAFDDYASFENELRTSLVKLISVTSSIASQKVMQFSADLSNGTLSLDDLLTRIKGGNISSASVQPVQNMQTAQNIPVPVRGAMKIVALNAPMRVELVVTKDNFVIGKKPDLCDGVISFNNMISRSHCKIINNANGYAVVDLQSANGTFVNGVRLQPNQPFVINNSDIIRLANSDFQVIIG